ncbi:MULTISPECIES: hypothetical protein [unclassified Novosphingobium]|uniref:hypothetical protein n=1 Tax=unclassified Novosphingobium TaxID=2644732 RepID=UPI001ACC1AF4|nr:MULTISPECIES: hypothetical protein [unclassified Novosphingobium]MBN9143173.1 hypothetical protein [Novosphingobium sp.]MDR6706261.1 hypothetical protein [Novosphingobium sp. 1748]
MTSIVGDYIGLPVAEPLGRDTGFGQCPSPAPTREENPPDQKIRRLLTDEPNQKSDAFIRLVESKIRRF